MLKRAVLPWTILALSLCFVSKVGCRDVSLLNDDDKFCSSPNVRTVIFQHSDLDKECWSREEMALLFTRRMMQELLPKRNPTSVVLLLDYLKECLETVKCLATTRRTHKLVVTAMADTLGGYLQAFGLPMARQAFYEGTLGYSGAKQLHELMDAFKKLLQTDGGGWTKPMKIMRCSRAIPFRLSKAPPGIDSCSTLVTRDELSTNCNENNVEILMPFLDDPCNPSAIALPFKDKNLYSLKGKGCANILLKYYSRAVWCLTQTYGTNSVSDSGPSRIPQVQCFFKSFNQWLNDYVIPRMKDTIWYPAFGSVLRLTETLNCKVRSLHKIKDKHFNKNDRHDDLIDDLNNSVVASPAKTRKSYIIAVSSVVIAFWIVVLLFSCVFKRYGKKKNKDNEEISSSAMTSEECSSSDSSESETITSCQTEKARSDKECKKENITHAT